MYRNILLSIHISSVAAWLGANLVQFALTPRMTKEGGALAAAWFRATAMLAQRYYNVAGITLGVSGVLLVRNAGYDWSAGFVIVGIVAIAIGATMGIAFFGPHSARSAAAAEEGRPVSVRTYVIGATFDTAVVLTALLAMVSKWRA